jgi:hypothetical protein
VFLGTPRCGTARFIRADVAIAADVNAMVKETIAHFGRVLGDGGGDRRVRPHPRARAVLRPAGPPAVAMILRRLTGPHVPRPLVVGDAPPPRQRVDQGGGGGALPGVRDPGPPGSGGVDGRRAPWHRWYATGHRTVRTSAPEAYLAEAQEDAGLDIVTDAGIRDLFAAGAEVAKGAPTAF